MLLGRWAYRFPVSLLQTKQSFCFLVQTSRKTVLPLMPQTACPQARACITPFNTTSYFSAWLLPSGNASSHNLFPSDPWYSSRPSLISWLFSPSLHSCLPRLTSFQSFYLASLLLFWWTDYSKTHDGNNLPLRLCCPKFPTIKSSMRGLITAVLQS